MDSDCVLCSSIDQPYRLVKKTKHTFAVVDKAPLKNNHILIMPIRHVISLGDLNGEESKDILELISYFENAFSKAFNFEPGLFKNFGRNCTQEHIHFHMLDASSTFRKPVSSYEGIPERKQLSKEEIGELKDRILEIMD